jgi:hypothetical protein
MALFGKGVQWFSSVMVSILAAKKGKKEVVLRFDPATTGREIK